MNNTNRAFGIILFLLFLLFIASVFTVNEGQQGIILRLGRLVNDADTDKLKVLNPGFILKLLLLKMCVFLIRVFKLWILNPLGLSLKKRKT